MERLLKSGLINLSELASRMYPEIERKQAAAKLGMKVRGTNGNRLNADDLVKVRHIIDAQLGRETK